MWLGPARDTFTNGKLVCVVHVSIISLIVLLFDGNKLLVAK